MANWRPIATAPKDGTRVLLYRSIWGETQAVCRWNADWDLWEGAMSATTFSGATHWQPLPAPPKGRTRT